MVALHTPFEYDPTDDQTRRVERAHLTFKPSRELSDKLTEFILPTKRRRALGLRGLSLYSNHSWNVYRNVEGELEPPDALMQQEFQRVNREMQQESRRLKLANFVVFREIQPPARQRWPMFVVGLMVSLGEELAQDLRDNVKVPDGLLSRNAIPVHIAFPGDIAIPSMHTASQQDQLERFVFGHSVSPAESIGAGESENANAYVTGIKVEFDSQSPDT